MLVVALIVPIFRLHGRNNIIWVGGHGWSRHEWRRKRYLMERDKISRSIVVGARPIEISVPNVRLTRLDKGHLLWVPHQGN